MIVPCGGALSDSSWQQEDFEAAADQIALLLPVEPSNARLKSALAVCYRRTGKYAEALILIRELLLDSPSSVEHMKAAVYCLDRMGARGGGHEGACELHGRARGVPFPGPDAPASCSTRRPRYEKSAETFRKAVSLAPTDWRANRNLGMVYRRMGNDAFRREVPAEGPRVRGGRPGKQAAAQARDAVRGAPSARVRCGTRDFRLYYRVRQQEESG